MSTILKALRRLEEDSSLDASTPLDPASPPNSLPATNPNATDELRNRILAEESAAQASGTELTDASTSKRRVRIVAAIAGATLVTALIVAGLVLGFGSLKTGPDNAPESNALASVSKSASRSQTPSPSPSPSPSGRSLPSPNPPRSPQSLSSPNPSASPQSPPSPSPPTPLAVSAEQAPSANGRSDSQPSAGPGLGVAAIPIVQSASAPTNGASSTPSSPPGPQRAASSPVPAPPPKRLTPQSATPAPFEEIAPVAVARTPAAPGTESPTADSSSVGFERRVPPTVASATQSKAESAPPSSRTAAESHATRPGPIRSAHPVSAPTVSTANPPTSPPVEKPLKATAEAPPKPSAESTAQPAPAAVEEHKGRAIPDITVLRTAWHPNPERRSAKIRLLETKETLNLREGDAVGGLVVQEISPSAVIFRSGAIELRLRVGQPGSGR